MGYRLINMTESSSTKWTCFVLFKNDVSSVLTFNVYRFEMDIQLLAKIWC